MWSYLLSGRIHVLVLQYIVACLLLYVWNYFPYINQYTLLAAVTLIVPRLDVALFQLRVFVAAPVGIGHLIFPGLVLVQLVQLAGIGLWVFRKFRPPSPDSTDAPLHGRQLRRPWWMTPLLMTGAIIMTVYLVARLFGDYGSLVPACIALALAALGLLSGGRFVSGARSIIGRNFGVQYLANDHWLTERVHKLAARLDLPPPAVGVTNAVNAFAMGASVKDAAVVIGAPLAKSLSPDELDAVIGHELGHIVSGDMRQMQLAEGYQTLFGNLFNIIGTISTAVAVNAAKTRSSAQAASAFGQLFTLLGRRIIFFASELLVKGLSRSREYYADAIGAGLTSPSAMANALRKLESLPATPTPAESQYGYLMFKGFRLGHPFATHPTVASRIKALEDGTFLRQLPRRRAGIA